MFISFVKVKGATVYGPALILPPIVPRSLPEKGKVVSKVISFVRAQFGTVDGSLGKVLFFTFSSEISDGLLQYYQISTITFSHTLNVLSFWRKLDS